MSPLAWLLEMMTLSLSLFQGGTHPTISEPSSLLWITWPTRPSVSLSRTCSSAWSRHMKSRLASRCSTRSTMLALITSSSSRLPWPPSSPSSCMYILLCVTTMLTDQPHTKSLPIQWPIAWPDHQHHLPSMGRQPIPPNLLPHTQYGLAQVLGHWQHMLTCSEPCLSCQAWWAGPALGAEHQDVGLLRCALPGPPNGAYVMVNVLFKISYRAEFHTQMAIEAVHIIHERLRVVGKLSNDIKSVCICTQEVAICSTMTFKVQHVIHPEQWQSLERGIRGSRAILYL